jgi:hypothetical protein
LLILLILVTSACNKKESRAVGASCEGVPIIGEWTASVQTTGEGIILRNDCTGHDIKCDQELYFGYSRGEIWVYAKSPSISPCFSNRNQCDAEVIGLVLELNCGAFTRSYKKD